MADELPPAQDQPVSTSPTYLYSTSPGIRTKDAALAEALQHPEMQFYSYVQYDNTGQYGSPAVGLNPAYSQSAYNASKGIPEPGNGGLYLSYVGGRTPIVSSIYTPGAEPYQGDPTKTSSVDLPGQVHLFAGYTSPNGGSSSDRGSATGDIVSPTGETATSQADRFFQRGEYAPQNQTPVIGGVVSYAQPIGPQQPSQVSPGAYLTGDVYGVTKAVPKDAGGSVPAPFVSSPSTPTPSLSEKATVAFDLAWKAATSAAAPGLYISNPRQDLTGTNVNAQNTAKAFASGDIGATYAALNKQLAPSTTDIVGIGALAETIPDTKAEGAIADIFNFGKNTAATFYQKPIDTAVAGVLAGGFAAGEYAVSAGVARAAASETIGISTAGRLASTPIATDLASVGKLAVGGVMIGGSIINAAAQPTASEKGKATGDILNQFIGFTSGYKAVELPTVNNPAQGIEFFSGQPAMGPIESATLSAKTFFTSLATKEPTAYRDVMVVTKASRMVEPGVKTEPNFAELSKAGSQADNIRSTLLEQPSSVYGSAATRNQFTPDIVESSGLRLGKDVDAFVEEPQAAISSLAKKMGAEEAAATDILDVHGFKEGYPIFKPSTAPEVSTPEDAGYVKSLSEGLYSKIAAPRTPAEIIQPGSPGYTGELTYEASSALMGRKAAAVAVVIEKPIEMGFRAPKDIYDFVTLYQAQKATALSRGTPPSAFSASDAALEDMLGRELTIGTVKHQKPGEGETFTGTMRDIMNTLDAGAKVESDAMVGGAYATVSPAMSGGSTVPFVAPISAPAPTFSGKTPADYVSKPSEDVSTGPVRGPNENTFSGYAPADYVSTEPTLGPNENTFSGWVPSDYASSSAVSDVSVVSDSVAASSLMRSSASTSELFESSTSSASASAPSVPTPAASSAILTSSSAVPYSSTFALAGPPSIVGGSNSSPSGLSSMGASVYGSPSGSSSGSSLFSTFGSPSSGSPSRSPSSGSPSFSPSSSGSPSSSPIGKPYGSIPGERGFLALPDLNPERRKRKKPKNKPAAFIETFSLDTKTTFGSGKVAGPSEIPGAIRREKAYKKAGLKFPGMNDGLKDPFEIPRRKTRRRKK